MRNHRLLSAAVVTVVCLISVQTNALNILLTNDDGYTSDGITIMFDELTNAGHNVTLVAPKTNQSGKGMAFNSEIFVPVEVLQVAPGKWFVDGTPVDSLQAGLDFVLVDNPPDLVVSGANFGENVGPITSQSGTVGAAQKALQRGIPAIAVSVSRDNSNLANTIAAMDDAARFVVQVIDELILETSERPRWCDHRPNARICQIPVGSIELPDRVGLNINHPALEAAETVGLVFTRISTYSTVDFTLAALPPPFDGQVYSQIVFNRTPPSEQEQTEDTVLLGQGNITVTTLDPDINANIFATFKIKKTLKDLF